MNINISNLENSRKSLLELMGKSESEVISEELYKPDRALKLIEANGQDVMNTTIRVYHYSTVSTVYPTNFGGSGVQSLFNSLKNHNSAFSKFLKRWGICIDVNHGLICYKNKTLNVATDDLDSDKSRVEAAWKSLKKRLSDDYAVNAFLADAARSYSMIARGPELLNDLDVVLELSDKLVSSWENESNMVVIVADIPLKKLESKYGWDWIVDKLINYGFPEQLGPSGGFSVNHYEYDVVRLKTSEDISPSEILEVYPIERDDLNLPYRYPCEL